MKELKAHKKIRFSIFHNNSQLNEIEKQLGITVYQKQTIQYRESNNSTNIETNIKLEYKE